MRIDRTKRLRPGQLFALYVFGYGVGRLWVEALRIDEASMIGPLRVNEWVSLLAIVGGAIGFVIAGRRGVARGLSEPAAVELVPVAAGSGQVVEDGVGEGGPQLDGPGPEGEVGEDHAGQADVGVDPEEGPGPAEVPERSG